MGGLNGPECEVVGHVPYVVSRQQLKSLLKLSQHWIGKGHPAWFDFSGHLASLTLQVFRGQTGCRSASSFVVEQPLRASHDPDGRAWNHEAMKLRREAAALKAKAVSSLRRAVRTFNDYEEDGRTSTVLLHFQHAFEMLLKAGLVQTRQTVFDGKVGRAIGFEKCVNLSQMYLRVTDEEAGTLRAIDALRDDEQHWMTTVSEGLLYLHCRAGTTLFDDILKRVFDDSLGAHLPNRVLPLSSEPPRDVQILLDEDYEQIKRLLAPGSRKRPDARARIRALLAMEAHSREDALVSKKDVDRVEKAIRADRKREEVFPILSDIGASLNGTGPDLQVRFVKKGGAPVQLVGDDDGAGAIREVDLQKKFHWSKAELAKKLQLDTGRCKALRWRLVIDDDDDCRHDFIFGKSTHRAYSDNAYTRMRDALGDGLDLDDIYSQYVDADHGKAPPQ